MKPSIVEQINLVMRDTAVGTFITVTGMAGATGLHYEQIMMKFEVYGELNKREVIRLLDDDIVYGTSAFKGVRGFVRVSELP